MTNNYCKKTKKNFTIIKKKHMKGTKIFLKKKKTKKHQYARDQDRNLSEKEKEKCQMVVNDIRIF